jgi:hypothetical protein
MISSIRPQISSLFPRRQRKNSSCHHMRVLHEQAVDDSQNHTLRRESIRAKESSKQWTSRTTSHISHAVGAGIHVDASPYAAGNSRRRTPSRTVRCPPQNGTGAPALRRLAKTRPPSIRVMPEKRGPRADHRSVYAFVAHQQIGTVSNDDSVHFLRAATPKQPLQLQNRSGSA